MVLTPLLVPACKDDDGDKPMDKCTDLTNIPYAPVPYQLPTLTGWNVTMLIPADNPLTEEGVDLGHKLFFDPILSVDSTIACASCHDPKLAFTDGKAVSTGVNGLTGTRSAMSVLNAGFFENGLFWDGRSPTLEDQALHPVENPLEMADTWENVEVKLQKHPDYPADFRKAFGIECAEEISREMVAKAIAQYERTLVSYNSRYDKKFYQGDTDPFLFTDEESDGYSIYFDEVGNGNVSAGHCNHCHNGLGATLTGNNYFNNGIEEVDSYDDFPDPGLGAVTGKQSDIGKFRAPTLRNIELTAPYMHDGRFQTLAEVIEHYNSGGHPFENGTPGSVIPQGLGFSEYEKKALEAFLRTLTDTTYFDDPHYLDPFQ
ncbi:MAG TPA: cytochrome C peroxidase [Bacteroidetes bacterium]|nr:cytochrome C peroxidase [Bacteroidota bacterium]